jgi:hypothetical protein
MSIRACVAYLEILERLLAARARRGGIDQQLEAAFATDLNDLRPAMTKAESEALDALVQVFGGAT